MGSNCFANHEKNEFLFIYFVLFILCLCLCIHTHATAHCVEIRGQQFSFHLYRGWGFISGCQALCQVSYPLSHFIITRSFLQQCYTESIMVPNCYPVNTCFFHSIFRQVDVFLCERDLNFLATQKNENANL